MEIMDIGSDALKLHEQKKGKLQIKSKVKLKNKLDLSLAYTPGVAEVCRKIAEDKENIYKYTIKQNSVAVVTDGSAVLGLGNIGPEAALPVMEGKAILFKEFAGIDAYPICLATQNVDEIIDIVKKISVGFGGINLEDISAPRCFEVEEKLQDIGIPVFHDDQHGTAVVVLAALINALRVVDKNFSDINVVISGAGAAGIAVAKLLCSREKNFSCVKDVILCDTKGIIYNGREDLKSNKYKEDISKITNRNKIKGNIADAMKNSDVFIGVSAPNIVTKEMVSSMNNNAIVFAMANPIPEIMPELAKEAGAKIIGTGRSDFPNQINNALAFPGIFRGALDARAKKITFDMKIAAAHALASCVKEPTADNFMPNILDKKVANAVARAVRNAAVKDKE